VKPLPELLREPKAVPERPLLARLRRHRWRVLPRLREAAALRRKLAQNLQNLLMPARERQRSAAERRRLAQSQQCGPRALAQAQPALEPRQAAPASMKQLVVQPR
jgi:hypothetical protein